MYFDQLKEKYGKQTALELIDFILIKGNDATREDWTMFLKRNGILSPRSRATVSGSVRVKEITRVYDLDQETGRWGYRNIEPCIQYVVNARNARGDTYLNVIIKSTEIEQFMEQLANEPTEPNESGELSSS